MSGGRTYIDVITTEGSAVVEVNVAGILPYDYCEFLGKTREEIYEQFGKSPYSDTDKQIMYLLSDGDFGYLVLILIYGQIPSKLFLLWQKNLHHYKCRDERIS